MIYDFIKEYPRTIPSNLKDIANYSDDPNTKVGAFIVNYKEILEHNKFNIISYGYNYLPGPDNLFPWSRDNDNTLLTKYPYVIHAETSAISKLINKNITINEDIAIATSLFPCSNCAKLIISSGIKYVLYLDDKYNGTSDNLAAKMLFAATGVTYIKL